MASLTKLRRSKAPPDAYVEALLFGSLQAPSDEAKAERARLIAKLAEAQRFLGAKTITAALAHLRKYRAQWNPEEHGQSEYMSMLDDIDALRWAEREARNEAKNGSSETGA